ncbi:MAG: lytic transglycosylase domain-containing protein [Gemmatimonadetes bacterium]|nr:lytic transglycosylase domain-containing protein [Gemmatimonadota bacterium]
MDAKRPGIVQELEAIVRRARLLVFAVPALLVVGFGAGHVLRDALRVASSGDVSDSSESDAHHIRIDALSQAMQRVRVVGEQTTGYVELYQSEIAPVESVLRRRGVPAATARRVAWPLVRQSRANGIDAATVLSVLLLESAGRPDATSSVGARGLMQVMPAWAGFWRGCGRNLYDIEANLCSGTRILAWYLERFRGDERRALLGYNGCVRGTNTPGCWSYPDKVASLRRQLRHELAAARSPRTRVVTIAD